MWKWMIGEQEATRTSPTEQRQSWAQVFDKSKKIKDTSLASLPGTREDIKSH